MILPRGTHIGSVHLRVPSLMRSLEFYETQMGFYAHPTGKRTADLRAREDGPAILQLTENPSAPPRPARTTGLFHAAIRLPNRPALGQALRRMVEQDMELGGFADHGVSEAIYLIDPDGNGLEFYADRPREQWPKSDGQVAMTTLPLDIHALLAEAETDGGTYIHPETDLGHVHLQVSNLKRTEEFYAGELGFNVTQRGYPGALFFAADDYHHHVGANTWAGRGAPRPPEQALGLISFSIILPDDSESERTQIVYDPDGIEIELMHTKPDAAEKLSAQMMNQHEQK